MHLVMFDIDGTLVDTSAFEDDCFVKAVASELSGEINTDWSSYAHMSDTGLVNQLIENILDKTERRNVFQRIHTKFVELISAHLEENKAAQIAGATPLINYLRERTDVVLAIATGGWRETAELKLRSANIEIRNIAFASSDDHFDRTQIMKIAQQRTRIQAFTSCTYIGDAVWDKVASNTLGFNFILVGDKTGHAKNVNDYTDLERVVSLIGLSA